MKRWIVIEFLSESMELEQIHIVEANNQQEAMQKTVTYPNNFFVISCDDVKIPYKHFSTQ